MIDRMSEMPSTDTVPQWTLGWRLQRALAHVGMTADAMADELGVHRGTVSRWMNDRGAPPRPIYLRQWSLRCGVPYEWLREGQDGPTGGPGAAAEGKCIQPTPLTSGFRRTSWQVRVAQPTTLPAAA